VIHFFKNCVIQQSPAICEFFSALSQDDRKREATKRKAMNSHKRKNAKRKTEGERNNDVEDGSTDNNVDDNGNAGDGNNPHPTGVGNNGADEGQTLNGTSQRAPSPTSITTDVFSRAPATEPKNSDNCGVIKGEIAPYFSASTQLIVRGLGCDALSLMNEDMNCVMGQTMKMIVEALVNNSDISITADTVETFNNLNASSSQDICCFLSHAISNFWTKVAIQEKAVSDGDPHTRDLPLIQIPHVAKARDLNAAMKYFSCTDWKDVNFTPHSDYFLVSAPRQLPNSVPPTAPTAIAGVEAIQIASTSNNSIFGKLESFIVYVGK
jgi:hypothetical protein